MSTSSYPSTPANLYPPPPPPGYASAYAYAGLGTRFVAAFVDLIILGMIAIVAALPFGIMTAISVLSTGGTGWVWSVFAGPFTLILWLLWILYFSYFESKTGQTLGKRLVNIRVIDVRTGRPPDLGKAVLRNLLRLVDWLPALYLLGFLVAALTPNKQRLGDLLADTVVVGS